MPTETHWNLTPLYPNPQSEQLRLDLQQLADQAASFRQSYKGSIANLSATELAKALNDYPMRKKFIV